MKARAEHQRRQAKYAIADSSKGILAQLEALQELRSAEPGISYFMWTMQALFFMIFALPGLAALANAWRRAGPAVA